MNPILLLCGFSAALEAEVQERCKDAFPGLSFIFMNTLEDASGYLTMEPPFEDRDYPAPHFMILQVEANHLDTELLSTLKRRKEFYRIPIILMAEGVERAILKEAFSWLYASVVETPSEKEEKIELIVETAGYWAEIVKLPLI